MKHAALHQPLNLESYARVNEVVEVAAGVFQREGVGIDELLGNEKVDFCGQICEAGELGAVGGLLVGRPERPFGCRRRSGSLTGADGFHCRGIAID